jgi:hypothetical protein
MKSINEKIEANQPFYNGVAVGLFAGAVFTILLFKGRITSPIVVKPEDIPSFRF